MGCFFGCVGGSKKRAGCHSEQLSRQFEQLKEAYRVGLAPAQPTTWYLAQKLGEFERQVKATRGFVEDASRQRG
jgi:uncharacterized protein